MTTPENLPQRGANLPRIQLGRTGADGRFDDHGETADPARPGDGAAFDDFAFFDGIVFKRLVGHLIDTLILSVVMVPIGFALVMTAVVSFGLLIVPFALAFLALRIVYYAVFTGGARNATPGMRLMGTELRRTDGGRPDVLLAFLRVGLYYATVTILTPLILLFVFFNRERQAVHDAITGTVVVNRLDAAAV